jgi:hypothetical protein
MFAAMTSIFAGSPGDLSPSTREAVDSATPAAVAARHLRLLVRYPVLREVREMSSGLLGRRGVLDTPALILESRSRIRPAAPCAMHRSSFTLMGMAMSFSLTTSVRRGRSTRALPERPRDEPNLPNDLSDGDTFFVSPVFGNGRRL